MRVEPLARRLGVTKGSFYWHFDARPDLLRAVLLRWEEGATEQVIAEVDAAEEAPAARLASLTARSFGQASGYGALEAAVRGWALTDSAAADVVSRVDDRRLTYVTGLLADAGVDPDRAAQRAALYYRVLVGEFTWTGYGGAPLSGPALEDLLRLLLST